LAVLGYERRMSRPRASDAVYKRFCKRLGRRVASLRQERGLTQEDMSRFGFSWRRYQRIEAGQPITMRTAHRLAKAFRISVGELVDGIK
jgi:transcriptional regulator with XRE-family HTH domain